MTPTVAKIEVDVVCSATASANCYYRIYVDNDLITERNWRWHSYEIYIREHLEAVLHAGTHDISIVTNQTPSPFQLKNLSVQANSIDGNGQQLQFCI
jgi:hypothetical protein